jgi:hypothetical protein
LVVGTNTPVSGAVVLAGAGVSQSGQTFTFSGGGAGASILGSATGSVATNTTGQISIGVATGAQTGVLTSATGITIPQAGAGALTTLTGDATGSVATTAQNISVIVSPTAQTGVRTTADTMVLPPAGTGGGNMTATNLGGTGGDPAAALNWLPSTAYVPGDVVRQQTNLQTYVCILAVNGTTLPADDVTHWASIGVYNGVITGINGNSGTTVTTSTNGAVEVSVGTITTTTSATTLAFTGAGSTLTLGGNIQSGGGGGGVTPALAFVAQIGNIVMTTLSVYAQAPTTPPSLPNAWCIPGVTTNPGASTAWVSAPLRLATTWTPTATFAITPEQFMSLSLQRTTTSNTGATSIVGPTQPSATGTSASLDFILTGVSATNGRNADIIIWTL